MASKRNVEIIAIEEHFSDREVIETLGMKQPPALVELLSDLGNKRLAAMDAAGVDVQVLSLNAPGTQQCDPETAVRLAGGANDRLAEAIKANPDRFSGFAAIPTPDPAAAADELSRAVNELGFKGVMVSGLTNGEFLDEKKFWPIFERAQQLDVPIYIHPAIPDKTVISRYYETYAKDFPRILSAGWGYTVEAATQGVRLILSGVFDAYPNLKIILGHLGEGLPFLLRRMDEAFSRAGNKPLSFRDTFCSHFYITTSGNFSDPALQCTLMEMGADRVMFAIDYPFVMNEPGVEWIEQVMLSEEDRAKILSGNTKRLLRL